MSTSVGSIGIKHHLTQYNGINPTHQPQSNWSSKTKHSATCSLQDIRQCVMAFNSVKAAFISDD